MRAIKSTEDSFRKQLEIDTKDILFICGGALVDLEKTISERKTFFFFHSFCTIPFEEPWFSILFLNFLGVDNESLVYIRSFNMYILGYDFIWIDHTEFLMMKHALRSFMEITEEGRREAQCNMFSGLEGLVEKVEARHIDTKDILFICGGAFVDLEKTISENSSIGFGAPVRGNMRSGLITNAAIASSLLESVESSDLIAYGLIPEFVGRFPILVNLSALTEDQLVQVLMEPKNALGKQYKKMFSINNVKLYFTEKALRLIAKKAMAKNTSARGLRAILESILTDAMYEIPDTKRGNDKIDAVVVDEDSVGTTNAPGCGGKILCGNGALERYLEETKLKDQVENDVRTETEVVEGESEASSRAMSM
ncbi:hypothetical protein M9H77_33070 [Catharanthus roseus]|uniref:Uncharacterized protein n=1 Tax=Catharanthus roseus TaxID=4058 RepID=A0ACB9ZKU4_CATRO|nr:hypothetical protein M9H77_33070 [Catharanthus roseus]